MLTQNKTVTGLSDGRDNQVATLDPPPELQALLCRLVTRGREILQFEKFLRAETAWLTAPASTRFHFACEGGLVRHACNVTRTLLELRTLLAPDISEESCIIVGLYHDLGKAGMPGMPYYLPNPSQWHIKNRGIHYVVSKDMAYMDIASRSLFLVAQHLPLSNEEAQAIRYHDGQYIDENSSVAHREARLTLLLQYADNWSGEVLEKEPDQT